MKRRTPPRDLNNLTGLRIGLYCRVSQDRDSERDENSKSVDDQEQVGRDWVTGHGAVVADIYADPNRSASRFATKVRENFQRLLADVNAGRLDAIWFWELSRSQRRLDVFAELRDLCRERAVLWVIRDRVYDPAAYADMMTLGMLTVVGEMESELTSQRVIRGKASAASAGKPAGRNIYGYRREYAIDDSGKRILKAVHRREDQAQVVEEIFERFARGDSIRSITRDLNHRGVPTSRGAKEWTTMTVRHILVSPNYISRRVYQGGVLDGVVAQWPALVDEEVFWTCQEVLSDPSRKTRRHTRAVHLLSYLAKCDRCGALLTCMRDPGSGNRSDRRVYKCQATPSCVAIYEPRLDEYVERVVVAWLADPDWYAYLMRIDDSDEGAAARAEAHEIRSELQEWRQFAGKPGGPSPMAFADAESRLLARLEEAESRANKSAVPPVLRGTMGPEAASRWAALELGAKRQVISTIADIRLKRIGCGRRNYDMRDRVSWTWLLGPVEDVRPATGNGND